MCVCSVNNSWLLGLLYYFTIYFDVITDHSISITNNVTDNYLENNTAIQDAIAHAPIECSINGMIGELVYVPSTSNGRFLNSLYKRLNDKINLKAIGANKINGEYRDYVVTDKLSALGQLFPPVDNLTQLGLDNQYLLLSYHFIAFSINTLVNYLGLRRWLHSHGLHMEQVKLFIIKNPWLKTLKAVLNTNF